MAGIYIHIPFCKQACHYCDFHFSTNIGLKQKMVKMIVKELEIQKDYLGKQEVIRTLYFGGGTPSLLSPFELEEILDAVHRHYSLDLQELTIETNPDDLLPEKLKALKKMGFDRLSIGIQSFDDRVLKFYNRAHHAEESLLAIDKAMQADFNKLSIDLIYGFPQPNHEIWRKDLATAISLGPGHISSYALTIEPDTVLGRRTEKGSFETASEDFIAEQFEMMQYELEQASYVQYEISNFGKPGAFALHNTNYWMGIPYLGIGPSAHSFDGMNRQQNLPNNGRYIKALESGQVPYELETMDKLDALNEYVLTSLRTIWGIDTVYISNKYQRDFLEEKKAEIHQLELQGLLEKKDEKLILTRKAMLLADGIAVKLFV